DDPRLRRWSGSLGIQGAVHLRNDGQVAHAGIDEFEAYGYRRVDAELPPSWHRRVHNYPIVPNLALTPAIRQGVACIIPTVDRSMPPKTIAPSCKSTVSPAPWAGAAIPTTTPRSRAS